MQDYEQLGAFYLGKKYDLGDRAMLEELILYDSKDLTTHAMCVGMTGSGKTGLCLSLLEEAAIDGVPAIMIDPKGDLANLSLSFPKLDAESFRPWIEESEATRAGMNPDQFAAETAKRWKQGLADWGQDAARIKRFQDSVDIPIYTPGSNAGLPLTVLKSFDAPPPEFVDDIDAFRQRVSSSASGLLALLGIDADPVRSREHILLSTLLGGAWREQRNMDVASLIHEIQRPPIEKIGVVDLETFYPAKDRLELAMSLNNLLASPSFASWMEGEPLNISRLLHTPEGKPRLSIISIAHLSDAERMFFVTILLNEVLTWMRGQPGTSSLRALLYMDEVFGFFPPVKNPPSKGPMLTLLKQARAYGLGVVLATQNPVDLDYKGLSNIGTWWLGRLQTERDKRRVLEGLEGAAIQSGSNFDRGQMDATLAALGKRVFLMNNVHEDQPVVFHTRWAMSYLRGPLTRGHIKKLMDPRKPPPEPIAKTPSPSTVLEPKKATKKKKAETVSGKQKLTCERPTLPSKIDEKFLATTRTLPEGFTAVYRPALLARVTLHFARASYKIDSWEEVTLMSSLWDGAKGSPWPKAKRVEEDVLTVESTPEADFSFADWPARLTKSNSYSTWQKQLKTHCYQTHTLSVWKCAHLKSYSLAGETEGEFRVRLAQLARQKRDLEVEKLRKRYSKKLATLEKRKATAEERVRREKAQYHKASFDSVMSIGSSLVGALFGRKLASRTNVTRASSSARKLSGAAQQRGDIAGAEEKLAVYKQEIVELDKQFTLDSKALEQAYHPDALELEALPLRPRKTDIQIPTFSVTWTPWYIDDSGQAEPAYELGDQE